MTVSAVTATVLHLQDYLESSRLYRVVSREHGVLSVIARGVRRGGARSSAPPDLFASGVAQVDLRRGRDLHALRDFEATVPRLGLALDLSRVLAASALAEVTLRFMADEAAPAAYDVIVEGLDAIAQAPPEVADAFALAAIWRLVAMLGFAPALDACALCGAPIPWDVEGTAFHHRSGGALCADCARPWLRASGRIEGGRVLPSVVRRQLASWTGVHAGPEADVPPTTGEAALGGPAVRAHQRLLREFLAEHLTERRELRAFTAWERGGAGE